MATHAAEAELPVKWAKVIDQTRCIGCHACTTACKSENQVPLGVTRTYVKSVDVGLFPEARRAFQVTRCNQCDDAPCALACPTKAMFVRDDGIVDFDKSICIGCKACIAACPYDAIFINPDDRSAEKCNFCAHRIDMGLEPACAVVCPAEAILVGDMNDPDSAVARVSKGEAMAVRRPEKETRPKLFYKGAHQATMDPIAAARPPAGMFMWSEQGEVSHQVTSGHPGRRNSSAAAVLSYDVPHRAPWDFRVSLYTWTKSISAGTYLIAAILMLLGWVNTDGVVWKWIAPVTALAFLGLTGALLLWDLDHPERFYLIFLKHNWSSWLVKGAFLITGYGAILGLHLLASVTGHTEWTEVLVWPGMALAVLTAIYTAWLFSESKARDLWQSPLLPIHMAVQMLLAGAVTLSVVTGLREMAVVEVMVWTATAAIVLHLFLVWAETSMSHPTAHAHLAAWEMTQGRYRAWFWLSVLLVGFGSSAPWLGWWASVPALLGLLSYEHAHVQAAQAVPLA